MEFESILEYVKPCLKKKSQKKKKEKLNDGKLKMEKVKRPKDVGKPLSFVYACETQQLMPKAQNEILHQYCT